MSDKKADIFLLTIEFLDEEIKWFILIITFLLASNNDICYNRDFVTLFKVFKF
ncbi:MAG: hypothetical protein FWH29_08270 [Methanobrevibacter sp.]|nr:hypothetical protein [Methanobrevibacter sp.]